MLQLDPRFLASFFSNPPHLSGEISSEEIASILSQNELDQSSLERKRKPEEEAVSNHPLKKFTAIDQTTLSDAEIPRIMGIVKELKLELLQSSISDNYALHLRLLAHALCDRNIEDTTLEGSNVSVTLTPLLEYINVLPSEGFNKEAFIETTQAMLEMHAFFDKDILLKKCFYLNFLISNLKHPIEEAKTQMNQDQQQAASVLIEVVSKEEFISSFQQHFPVKLTCRSFQSEGRKILSTFSNVLKEAQQFTEVDLSPFLSSRLLSESLKNLETLFLEELNRLNLNFLSPVLDKVMKKLEGLKPGQEAWLPGGYFSLPYSHSMIYKFKRVSDELWNFSVVNTGAGIKNHESIFVEKKIYYNPVVEFENIPASYLFKRETSGSPFFLRKIFSYVFPTTYVANVTFNSPHPETAIYKLINIYLNGFRKQATESDSTRFISQQKSGTCTYRSIKASLFSFFKDYDSYKNWLFQFKHLLLKETYRLFRKNLSADPVNEHQHSIFYLAASNLITSIRKNIRRGAKNTKVLEAILQDAIFIQLTSARDLASIEEQGSNLSLYSLHLLQNKAEINCNIDTYSLNLAIEEYRLLPESGTKVISFGAISFPQLGLTSKTLISDLQKIAALLNSLDYSNLLFCLEYFRNLPFPSKWDMSQLDPREVLQLLDEISYQVYNQVMHHQVDTAILAFNLKVFLIGCNLVRLITPDFYEKYPIFDILSIRNYKLAFIKVSNEKLAAEFAECSKECKRLNLKAQTYDVELFESFLNARLDLDDDCTKTKKSVAELDLYQEMKSLTPALDLELLDIAGENSHSPLEVVEPLFIDLNDEDGFLEKHGYGAFTKLKHLFFHLYRYLTAKDFGADKISYELCRSTKLLSIGFGESQGYDFDEDEVFFNLDLPDTNQDNIGIFFDAISFNFLRLATTDIELDWKTGLEQTKETLLVNNLELMKEDFLETDTLKSAREVEFFVNLLIANINQNIKYKKILELLLTKSYLDVLHSGILCESFLLSILGRTKNNPDGQEFFRQLKIDESLRELVQEFADKFIDHAINSSISPAYKKIFLFLIDIKNFLSPTPFLVGLLEKLEKHSSARADLSQLILSTLLLTTNEDQSHDYLIKLLQAYFQIDQINVIEKYELKKVLESSAHLFLEPELQSKMAQLVANFIDPDSEEKPVSFHLNPVDLTFWIEYEKETKGVRLLTKEPVQQIGNDLFQREETIDHPVLNRGRLRKFLSQFKSKIYSTTTSAKKIYHGPFGQLVCLNPTESSENEDTIIFYEFSEALKLTLPEDLRNCTWIYLNPYIENPLSTQTDYDKPLAESPLTESMLLSSCAELFKVIPYNLLSIHHLLYSNKDDEIHVIGIDHQGCAIFHMELTEESLRIFDLKESLEITILDKTHPLSFLHGGQRLYLHFSNDGQKALLKTPRRDHFDSITLVDDNDSSIYLKEDPDFVLDLEKPLPFANFTHVLNFSSKTDESKKRFYVPWLLFKNKMQFLNSKSIQENPLLRYDIDDSGWKASSLEAAAYLPFLKVLSDSKDVYKCIADAFKILPLAYECEEKNYLYLEKLCTVACQFFRKSGGVKDPLSLFILNLYYYLKNHYKPKHAVSSLQNLLSQVEPIFAYYVENSQIPEFAKLTRDKISSDTFNGFLSSLPLKLKEILTQDEPETIGIPNERKIPELQFLPQLGLTALPKSASGERPKELTFLFNKTSSWQINSLGFFSNEELPASVKFPSWNLLALIHAIKTNEQLRNDLLFLLIERFVAPGKKTKISSSNFQDGRFESFLLAIALNPELIAHIQVEEISFNSSHERIHLKISYEHIPYFDASIARYTQNPSSPTISSPGSKSRYSTELYSHKALYLQNVRTFNPLMSVLGENSIEFKTEILLKSLELSHFHIRAQEIVSLSRRFLDQISLIPHEREFTHNYSTRSKIRKICIPQDAHLSRDFDLSKFSLTIVKPDALEHLRILIESLNRLFNQKESQLIQRLVHINESFKTDESFNIELTAHQYSNHKPHISLDLLVDVFLDESAQLYETVLGLFNIASLNPDQKLQFFTQLHEDLALILFIKIESRRLETLMKSLLSTDDASQISMILKTIAECDRTYLTNNLTFLIFEYKTGLNIRKNQLSILQEFEEPEFDLEDFSFSSKVAQLVMGGGKTSVIIPILAQVCNKKDQASLLITPASQKTGLLKSLKKSQQQIFNQNVIDISYMTRAMMTEHHLDKLLDILEESVNQSTLLVSTPEVIAGLELEFISSLESEPDSSKVNLLTKICNFIQSSVHGIVDEFAHVADVNRETNYPVKDHKNNYEKIDVSFISIFKALFSRLLSEDLVGITRIPRNEQMYISQETWNELIPLLASHLTPYIHKELTASGFTLDPQTIESVLNKKTLAEEIKELCLSNKKNKSIQLFALAHQAIHSILPAAFKKCGGRNYGRSAKEDFPGKVIPYQGVGCPSTTEFGFPYETLCFHFLIATQFETSEQIISLVSRILKNKAKPKSKALNISIDETEEGILFATMTGQSLSSQKLNLKDAKEKLDRERRENNFENLLSLERILCENYVGFHRFYFNNNPHNFFRQFKSVHGLTGTPWNHLSYSEIFEGNILLDDSVDQAIEQIFLSKKVLAGTNNSMMVTSTSVPSELLENAVSMLSSSDGLRLQAIIDSGGLFKNFTNEEVGISLLEFFKTKGGSSRIQAVVYFDYAEKKSDHPDQPTVLTFDAALGQLKKIRLDSLSSIQTTLKLSKDEYFIYFDERHTIGSDAVLGSRALALVTIDEKTPFYQFSQGVMRLREYFQDQEALVVIPDLLFEQSKDHFRTKETFLKFLKSNQENQVKSILFKSFKQQIDSVFRTACLDILTCIKDVESEDLATLYSLLRSFLLSEEEFNPVDLACQPAIEDCVFYLERYSSQTLSKFFDVLFSTEFDKFERQLSWFQENAEENLEASLESIQTQFVELKDLLDASQSSSGSKEIYIEQEVELEQELEEERESRSSSNSNSSLAAPKSEIKKFVPLDFAALIDAFSTTSKKWTDGESQIAILKELDLRLGVGFFIPYHDAFEFVHFSKSIFDVFEVRSECIFSNFKRKIGGMLLIVQNTEEGLPHKLTALAISNSETESAYNFLVNNKYERVFLVNTLGHLMLEHSESQMLDTPELQVLIKKAIIEIAVVNHSYETLGSLPVESYEWLTDQTPLKKIVDEETKTLGELRIRVLKTLIELKKDSDFLPLFDLIVDGTLFEAAKDEHLNAEEKIKKAKAALEQGLLDEVRSIISTLPKRMLDLLPVELIPYISTSNTRYLKSQEKISALAPDKLRYSKKSHLKFFSEEQLMRIITVDSRTDLIPVVASFMQTQLDSLPKSSKFSTSSFSLPIAQEKPGFPNLGNTCFANAALKSLMSLPNFRAWTQKQLTQKPAFLFTDSDTQIQSLRDGESPFHFAARIQMQILLHQLYEIYTNNQQDTSDQLSTILDEILSNPLMHAKGLQRGIQNDAHEFYMVLSEAMELDDDLSSSLIVRDQHFSMIPLNIYHPSPAISIQGLLDHCLETGHLTFSSEAPGSINCIGIQLPRFAENREKNPQLFTQIFSNCILRVQTSDGVRRLNLQPRSIVCHEGSTRSGHYTAIDIENGYYLLHNDSTVRKISIDQAEYFASKNGYLVFYNVELLPD